MLRRLSPVLMVATLGLTACGDDTPDTTDTTDTTLAVVREALGVDLDPPGADGRTLTLARYTIAPGAVLAPHIHPGVQLAHIEAGTLTYTVVSGTAEVTRADGTTETITGPTTSSLGAGDSVAEPFDMVHFGANETDEPVVILASLLTEDGADLAVPVTTVPGSSPDG